MSRTTDQTCESISENSIDNRESILLLASNTIKSAHILINFLNRKANITLVLHVKLLSLC